MKIDSEGVCAETLQGTYKIAWNDVIEIQYGQSNILFTGETGTQLIIPAPSLWSSSKKADLLIFPGEHLEKLNIPVKKSLGCDFKFFKGTKMAEQIK